MNEEEKKTIEKIERQILIGECEKAIGIPVYISDLKIVLNLIEKQKAEIERLNNLNNHQSKEIGKAVDYTFELNAELEKKDKIIEEALEIAFEYGQIDGEHHKIWVIDQIVKCLTGSDYNEWVAHYEYDEETQEEYKWHKGIAP